MFAINGSVEDISSLLKKAGKDASELIVDGELGKKGAIDKLATEAHMISAIKDLNRLGGIERMGNPWPKTIIEFTVKGIKEHLAAAKAGPCELDPERGISNETIIAAFAASAHQKSAEMMVDAIIKGAENKKPPVFNDRSEIGHLTREVSENYVAAQELSARFNLASIKLPDDLITKNFGKALKTLTSLEAERHETFKQVLRPELDLTVINNLPGLAKKTPTLSY
ncbi:MAG: hypothetical protein V1721_02725 [Pseudomonadota bacterium]